MSSTVLSLLVALVSVLGVMVPVIKEAFANKNSHLVLMGHATFSNDYSHLVVVFSNTGTRAGRFSGALAEINDKQGQSLLRLFDMKEIGVILPGESKEFHLPRQGKYENWLLARKNSHELEDYTCTLRFFVVDFKGRLSTVEDKADCAIVHMFFTQTLLTE